MPISQAATNNKGIIKARDQDLTIYKSPKSLAHPASSASSQVWTTQKTLSLPSYGMPLTQDWYLRIFVGNSSALPDLQTALRIILGLNNLDAVSRLNCIGTRTHRGSRDLRIWQAAHWAKDLKDLYMVKSRCLTCCILSHFWSFNFNIEAIVCFALQHWSLRIHPWRFATCNSRFMSLLGDLATNNVKLTRAILSF